MKVTVTKLGQNITKVFPPTSHVYLNEMRCFGFLHLIHVIVFFKLNLQVQSYATLNDAPRMTTKLSSFIKELNLHFYNFAYV